MNPIRQAMDAPNIFMLNKQTNRLNYSRVILSIAKK